MMNAGKPQASEPTPDTKSSRGLVITGIVGAGIVALCCFTPILVGLLAVLGLGALTGYLDFVLLPALLFFICLLAYGLNKQRKGQAPCCTGPSLNRSEKVGQNQND
ncbi:MAG: mercury resistance system transport protein MerF [Nitrospira sp.]|nr:mercury resistance system transport protein MerF [Nitrospira sp.]